MKFAICDDSNDARDTIREAINCICFAPTTVNYCEFSSGEELLSRIKQGEKFDIIFLDVEMDGISGIQAGQMIREIDNKAIIIFISAYTKYAIDAFDCEAFYYIIKPFTNEKFKDVFSKAIKKYQVYHQYYIVNFKNSQIKIPVNSIVYIESFKKHLIIHTINENYEVVGKMNEAINYLQKYGFYQVHQGYIVNFHMVRKFDKDDVIMDNGERVMISIRKKSEVLKAFTRFVEDWK